MHCDYCFYCDETAKRQQQSYGFMSEETLKNVIKRTLMRTDGVYSLAFQGGEPTLRCMDFFETAAEYTRKYNRNHAEVNLAIQTNGYALDEQWCQMLRDEHFLVGLSADGLPEIHDLYRHGNDGGSSWAHVLRAASLMDQYNVEYNILTVVHRKTAEHVKEIYEAYKKHGWNYQQYILCLDPLGEEHGTREYSVSPEEYGEFLTTLFDLWDEDFQKGEEPYIRQFDNYIAILLGRMPESCEQRGTCGMQYVVEADGSVYPCDFYALDQWKLGDFNDDLLPAIDERRLEKGFVGRSERLSEKCLQCRWLSLCRCGCFRQRVMDTENEGMYINYYCTGLQMFFDACGERLRADAAEVGRRNLMK